MSLLSKNFKQNDKVITKNCKDPNISGKSGVIMGKLSKPTRIGRADHYIVILDNPPNGYQWKAIELHEQHLNKL